MSAVKDLKQCTGTILNYLYDGDVTKLHLVAASHPRAASVERILEFNPMLMGARYCRTDVAAQQSQEGNDASSLVAIQVREALNLAAANAKLRLWKCLNHGRCERRIGYR
jgi:hypothetical protein